MLNLHLQTLERDGKRYVMVPYEEFQAIRESLEDLDDLRELRDAKARAKRPRARWPM